MEKYKSIIAESISEKYPELDIIFSTPPDSSIGDISIPCFNFAKTLKKNPTIIAEELKNHLENLYFMDKIQSNNGYLNFYLKKQIIFEDILNEISIMKTKYGSSMSGKGKKALIEHTSINPNASPHVGRARNALIGDSIVKMLNFEGYDVDVHYFVNDIGKQISMLLLGAKDKTDISFQDLLGIYIDINEKVTHNPELEKDVFDLLYKLENGDEEVREAFKNLVDICIKGQTSIFAELGIFYNTFDYESNYIYNQTIYNLLDMFNKTGKLKEDEDGRLVLNQEEYNLPMKAPYLVLTRKDKTSLYPLRDIAYTIDKVNSNADINIIILGEDQKLYFKQIASALDLLGLSSPTPVHYSFVLLSEGKMATRKGNVVLLEDFMKEAVLKASAEITKRHGKSDEKTSKAIGFGAVKYAILKASNDKNVIFDWENALSFEGDSGPYLQYSLARINSILRKYGNTLPSFIDYSVLQSSFEYDLLKELSYFKATFKIALKEYSPHIIANYLYGLTKKFSSFYHDCPILSLENEDLKLARLSLISATKQVILNCFYILGIEPVDSM